MPEPAEPPDAAAVDLDEPSRGCTRSALLRRGALALAAAGGSGVAVVGLPKLATSASSPSAQQDRDVLNFALLLERLQVAFYERALRELPLRGELRQYARTVHRHEVAHERALADALGGAAARSPTFVLDRATSDVDAFVASAIALEDAVVGGYSGQAVNLTPAALRSAAPIVSVESRHAAWIRDIAGELPAPRGVDQLLSEPDVRARLTDAQLEVRTP